MVGELIRITIAYKNSNNKTIESKRNINPKNLSKYGIYRTNIETNEPVFAKKIKIQNKKGNIVTKSKPVNLKNLFKTREGYYVNISSNYTKPEKKLKDKSTNTKQLKKIKFQNTKGNIVNIIKPKNTKNLFRMPEGYYVNYEPKKLVSIKVKRYDTTGNIRTDTIVETQERIKLGYRRRGKAYVRNNKPFQATDKEGIDVARGIPLPERFVAGTITFTFPNGITKKINTRSRSQRKNTSYTKEDMVGQAINYAVAQLLNSNIIGELISAGIKVGSDDLKQYITDMDLNLVKWI